MDTTTTKLAETPARQADLPLSPTSSDQPNRPVPVFSTAGFFSVESSPRTVINFNPGWRFLKGDVEGAEAPEFDDSQWEAANLPHGLEILGENGSGCRNYQGPAWYRKRFDATPGSGKVFLYFEAVMGKCAVWINGNKVAEHFGGYLPFVVDAGPLLNANGQGNIVVVRADNSDDSTYPPGKPQYSLDFTYFGGMYRDVYLIQTPAVHVTLTELSKEVAGGGIFVATKDVNGNDAELEVRTEVINESSEAKRLAVVTVLETVDGEVLLKENVHVELAAGASKQITQSLTPKNVHLWHPDDPYLHFIRTEIREGGVLVDTLKTRFGIRLFEMRGPDGFFVNKKFIGKKLSGVNRHQDYHFVGNAVPNSGQWRDAKLLREGGNTIIRAAHYPMDPAFFDACDELGLLVTTANPGWQFYNYKDPRFEQRIYQDTKELVRRDRNRPSVLLWETTLNETLDQPLHVLKEMIRMANEEYPFPGFFTIADHGDAKKGGASLYYSVNEHEPTTNYFTREYGDCCDNFFSHNAPVRIKREWGEAALIGQAIARARGSDLRAHGLSIRSSGLEWVYGGSRLHFGAALWCGFDHQRGYHPDPFWGGLMDGARVPRYEYFLFKSQYDPEYKVPGIETGPMVKITNELTQISAADVVVFSNCEEVRLSWLGEVVETRKPDDEYLNLPHPPFTFKNVFDFGSMKVITKRNTENITMIAEGLIGGKVVVREEKRYPERTTGIMVYVDDAGVGLTADGSDFVPVRAVVVDNKGVPKVLGSEYVYFEVQGPGEIIGGSSSQCNPTWTEYGTATALLRATTTPGLIKIRAHAKGLVSGETVVTSVAPLLPLGFDSDYVATSKSSNSHAALAIQVGGHQGGDDVIQLKKELRQMQLEHTSMQQELMELRCLGGNQGSREHLWPV